MKYVKQFGIILLITFIGEILHKAVPVPVPAGIYGIGLLFAALKLRLILPGDVREVSRFLIQIMPLMFIPAAAGLIDTWDILAPSWIQFAFVTVVTTVFVMAVSGLVTQIIINYRSRKQGRG